MELEQRTRSRIFAVSDMHKEFDEDAVQRAQAMMEREASAVISPCGQYRYWLERVWEGGLVNNILQTRMVFVMANPSTADAELDDPTIRKCIGFAKRHKHSGIVVVNVLAGRATKPEALLAMKDPVGPENATYIRRISETFPEDHIVCAWGNAIVKPLRKHIKTTTNILFEGDRNGFPRVLYCFGTTKDGSPRHPLMLAYDTPLEEFKP